MLSKKSHLILELLDTMRYCVHHLVVSILLDAGFQRTFSLSTEPVVTSGFEFGQRMVFSEPGGNNPYFSYLNFDSNNSSRMYIGAVDFLYRFNADNISSGSEKSVNLTSVGRYQDILNMSIRTCHSLQNYDKQNYRCRNHIRAAFPIGNEIYICATGVYSPQAFFLSYNSLGFVDLVDEQEVGSSGLALCPNDPDAQYTILYVDRGRGAPGNLPAIFSSMNYVKTMYRSSLQLNLTSPIQSSLQLSFQKDISFVASFEIDQYVYYFFREIALEANGFDTVRYSRVGRICKNDLGSSLQRGRFLTFVKATLNCSIGGSGDDIPIYYNNLYDVQYDASSQMFYGLFMANQNSSWGSAVCRFSYDNILSKFETGRFFSQDENGKLWTITPDDRVPKSRPSSCQASDTRLLSMSDQSFALAHDLMAGTIYQNTTSPLYYNRDLGFSRFTTDIVEGFEETFTVFCLYSDMKPDSIVRVVQWSRNGVVKSRIFSILKPFDDNKSTLREMAFRKSLKKSWLYIIKDTAIYQISMDVCSQYKLCTDCVIDPYCGWNSTSNTCVPYSTGTLQNVPSSSALTACNAVCKISTSSSQFCIPGMALHMNCSSFCSPEGSVQWLFPNGSTVQTEDRNYVLTQNGGLVILNVTSNLSGKFSCLSNSVVLAEHSIRTASCQYSDDIKSIVVREYMNWCQAFEEYKTTYNDWYCSKPEGACSQSFCKDSTFCQKN